MTQSTYQPSNAQLVAKQVKFTNVEIVRWKQYIDTNYERMQMLGFADVRVEVPALGLRFTLINCTVKFILGEPALEMPKCESWKEDDPKKYPTVRALSPEFRDAIKLQVFSDQRVKDAIAAVEARQGNTNRTRNDEQDNLFGEDELPY